MNKKFGSMMLSLFMLLFLSGCAPNGNKSSSMISIYAITTILSLALLIGCWLLIRKRDKWFILLFSSVFIVNTGYLALALSRDLETALMANRLSYLGSVFLPLSMLMIIMNVCHLNYRKRLPGCLFGLSTLVFLVAASPGILDIYYKEVSLAIVNGVAVLNKVYGPLHSLYMVYLLGYFAAMVLVTFRASAKKKITSTMHAVSITMAVFVNIGVWLLEQFVHFDIELLAVSYIISELFLISLYLIQMEQERLLSAIPEHSADADDHPADVPEIQNHNHPDDVQVVDHPSEPSFEERCAYFSAQIIRLTPTEQIVFDAYLEGKTPKDIMQMMNIKETTLKYHNRNIYSKLGVSSRKQMLEIAAALNLKKASA